jgi:hypothetical protein
MGCLRGATPLPQKSLPLSFEGEGDTGGEVESEKEASQNKIRLQAKK